MTSFRLRQLLFAVSAVALVTGAGGVRAEDAPDNLPEHADPAEVTEGAGSADSADAAEPADAVEADRLAGEEALRKGTATAVPVHDLTAAGDEAAEEKDEKDEKEDDASTAADDGKTSAQAEASDAAEKPKKQAAKGEKTTKADESDKAAKNDDQEFHVVVKGLQGAVLENVEAHLTSVPKDITVRGRYRTRVRQAIREGLRALGYYHAQIKLTWEPNAKGKRGNTLLAEVTPGEPMRLKEVNVSVTGEGGDDRLFKRLLRRAPKPGHRVDHGQYDTFKQQLQAVALPKGYFDAEFRQSRLAVSPDLNQGFWDIEYDTGIRYRYGEVDFQGSQIEEAYLRNLMPFQTGEHYDAESVAEMNRRLSETGWFSSVMVAPDWDKAQALRAAGEENVLPITGVVAPATKNSVEAGVGYATDVGPRLQTTWTRPWVNEKGHSLKGTLNLSAYEQILDGVYKIPEVENPLTEYWQIQSGLKRTDLNDTESNAVTLMVSRYWELESGWQRSLGMKWSYDDFTQGEETHKTMLLYPGVTLSRTRTKGGLMPRWGDSLRFTLDVSNTFWGSDVDFIAFNAQGALIRTLARKHRFVMRGNFGWIETDDFDRVPPDLRFFAGGDRSIRGYDYKSISPEDENGDLTGASRLLTASLEYQFNVTGKWWGAVFFDAGEAVNDFKMDLKKGAGLGIRWESPVGPVKLDLARPVGDPDHKGIAFYIGLGPEF